MELLCPFKNFEWGKIGKESMVAQLLSIHQSLTIDPLKPYAELWIGAHPCGPALFVQRCSFISSYLQYNYDALGQDVLEKFGLTIPFLLKILSIRKALSIQAHPAKDHAEELHRLFPELYQDPNHKPELAIALTPLEALCGFRPISEIKKFVQDLPELAELMSRKSLSTFLNSDVTDITENDLKTLFNSIMTCNKIVVKLSLENLLCRLGKQDSSTQSYFLYSLVKTLAKDYPGDVGCFAPYFMNYLTLAPGQAIYIKPNMPHAYLSGDCVECMASSDNVVRAGLTNKYIDIPTLVGMLDYKSYRCEDLLFEPELEDENCCIWRPPVPDFAVAKIKVQGDPYNTIIRRSVSFIIFLSGTGEACDTEPVQIRSGVILFLKANRQLTITPAPDSHIEAYQAFCNI